jgi:hypothetical protein
MQGGLRVGTHSASEISVLMSGTEQRNRDSQRSRCFERGLDREGFDCIRKMDLILKSKLNLHVLKTLT